MSWKEGKVVVSQRYIGPGSHLNYSDLPTERPSQEQLIVTSCQDMPRYSGDAGYVPGVKRRVHSDARRNLSD
jgi:hypothetical protein